jgi:hypothetical protein
VGGRGGGERAWEGEYGANTVYTCMWIEKGNLLKCSQEWGRGHKGEWWRGWIQLWYIWYIVRTLVNVAVYPQDNKKIFKKEKKKKDSFSKKISTSILCKYLLKSYLL